MDLSHKWQAIRPDADIGRFSANPIIQLSCRVISREHWCCGDSALFLGGYLDVWDSSALQFEE